MQEEAKNEGTRSKGIFSDNYLSFGAGNPPYPPAGYPPQHGSSYSQHGSSYAQHGSSYPQHESSYPQHESSYPHHGYPPPPPPTAYPFYGYPQPSYPSPAPVPAYSYPYNYGHADPYGPDPYGPDPYGPGKHQQHHLDYYQHQEFNMYEGYAHNNHGYGRRRRYGMSREVPSDAKV